jgi:Tol biopolymer transport system component
VKHWLAAVTASAFALAACSSGSGGSLSTGLGTPAGAAGTPTGSPTMSPSGVGVPPGLIVFQRVDPSPNDAEGQYEGTFITNTNGTDVHRLSLPTGWYVAGDSAVAWSPDGSRLLINLSLDPEGPGRAAIVGPDGTVFTMLDPGNLGARSVGSDASIGCSAWSPDGTTLLCSVESDQHKTVDGIYSILADGSGLTQLTTSPYHHTSGPAGECGGGDGEADYSSDGAQFVFMRLRCGTGADPSSDESAALYVENIDGTGLRKIVDYGQASSYPGSNVRWSPDGSEILFGDPDGFLWLVHPDGTDLTQIHLVWAASGTAHRGRTGRLTGSGSCSPCTWVTVPPLPSSSRGRTART